MRLLAQQGLVEHIPGAARGWPPSSDGRRRELYEVRDVLERHAVVTMPTRPDLTGLRAALDVMAQGHRVRRPARAGERAPPLPHRGGAAERQPPSWPRLYESILVRIQLYMAVNMRREAEISPAPRTACTGTSGCSPPEEAGDVQGILLGLSEHGARTYLPCETSALQDEATAETGLSTIDGVDAREIVDEVAARLTGLSHGRVPHFAYRPERNANRLSATRRPLQLARSLPPTSRRRRLAPRHHRGGAWRPDITAAAAGGATGGEERNR
jgi:hypothetical protein